MRRRLKLMRTGLRSRIFRRRNDTGAVEMMNKVMDDKIRNEGKGQYESPFLVICSVDVEGVLCQSDGSTSDDLGIGDSWEDKLWKD